MHWLKHEAVRVSEKKKRKSASYVQEMRTCCGMAVLRGLASVYIVTTTLTSTIQTGFCQKLDHIYIFQVLLVHLWYHLNYVYEQTIVTCMHVDCAYGKINVTVHMLSLFCW